METAMAIQYYTGIGRAEICGPIGLSDGTLTYRRKKTGKLKVIKISEALRPYLAHLPQGIHRIVPWTSVDTYSHKFAEIAEKAGLDISPHKLRHAFAGHALNHHARLEDVSELMDHSSVDITKRFYGHISDERQEQTINLLNLKRKA
jgi:integrase